MSMSAPAPPDPEATAKAQQTLNQNTAKYQQEVNNINQITPYGNVTYTQTGTNPDGSPIFTANTQLSPAQQKLFDASTGTQAKIAEAASGLADNLGSSLTHAPNLNNSALVNQMMGWGTQVMQPQLNQEKSSLDSSLANQGIAVGSDAWNNAQRGFAQNENQAYANFFSSLQPQAFNQALASYQAPIQTLGTLLGEGLPSSVNQNLAPTAQASIQPANYEGLVQDNYKSQLSNYENTMSGIFGLGDALAGGWAKAGFKLSDARAKDDIKNVGELHDGTPIYSYRYKGSPETEIGFVAQDLQRTKPNAVARMPGGLFGVNIREALRGA